MVISDTLCTSERVMIPCYYFSCALSPLFVFFFCLKKSDYKIIRLNEGSKVAAVSLSVPRLGGIPC